MPDQRPDNRGPILFLLLLMLVGLLSVAWGLGRTAPTDIEPGRPGEHRGLPVRHARGGRPATGDRVARPLRRHVDQPDGGPAGQPDR